MTKDKDCLMVHYISSNIGNNAAKFSHNSLSGHAHSLFGIAYHADKASLRWSMSVGALLDPNSPASRYGAGAILKRPIMGCGVLVSEGYRFLVIPDLHIPYHHEDSFEFLAAVADKFEVDFVLNVGDLIDHHAGSFHDSEPDALSPEDEFEVSKGFAKDLQYIFPQMVIALGNHDNIPKRKLKAAGLPSSMLSDFNALYELEESWQWVDEYWFDSKGCRPVLVPMTLNTKGRWDGKLIF